MQLDYWRQQKPNEPLFPDLEWSKPEQKAHAGRLGIIGGNKLGFAGVAEAYSVAYQTGAGDVKVLLPDCLKKSIPTSWVDVAMGACTTSGGLGKDALPDMMALAQWSTILLLIGDAGRNSETAILYESLLRNSDRPIAITRDAVDLVKNAPEMLVNRPNTLLVLSFAQLQKLFQAVYYPKVLTFSMQLMQLVEAVHKFTITYPITIVVLHKDTVIVAHMGTVTTTPWDSPMLIWRGTTATKAACYWGWSLNQPLESITASLVSK